MNRSIGRFAVSSNLILLALTGVGCTEEIEAPAPVLRPVRVHRVEAASGQERVAYAGVAKAGIESRLSFRVAGTLESAPARVGDRVQRGDVLARLDPTDFELSVERSEASLAQSRASLRQAEADFDRTRALYENNNASKAELDAQRAAAESAVAQVEAAQKALAQARQQLAYTELASPMAGAIAAVNIEVNENVSAGQEVFRLAGESAPEVEIRVPEIAIAQIAPGQRAEVRFDALAGRTLEATVTEVGVAALGAATFLVTVRIDDREGAVRSGMAAEVSLWIENPAVTSLGAVYIPLLAVGEDREGRFVFILEAGEGPAAKVRRRPVEVGELGEQGLAVTAGLEVGEQVVTAGVRRLVDGMEVRAIGSGEAP